MKSLSLTARRRIVQFLSLIALNTRFWPLAVAERLNGSFCLPIMNCEACVLAWFGCPVGMIGRSLVGLEFPLIVFGVLLVVGVLMGRFLCGWVCPVGFLQDMLHRIPSRKIRLPRFAPHVKYAVLLVAVIGVPLWYALRPLPPEAGDIGGRPVDEGVVAAGEGFPPDEGADVPAGGFPADEGTDVAADFSADEGVDVAGDSFPADESVDGGAPAARVFEAPPPAYTGQPHAKSKLFFCNWCPPATLQVVVPEMVGDPYRPDTWRVIRLSILAAVLILAVLNRRSFCKVLCPVGALIAVANKVSLHRVWLRADACNQCKQCNRACPMDVAVMESQMRVRPDKLNRHAVNRDTECVECLRCEDVCPTHAISNNSRVLRRKP